MARIGTLTQDGDGFTGFLSTISVRTRISLTPATKTEKGPDFRITTKDGTELGAAWRKTNANDVPYLNLAFDDPSWPAPAFATVYTDADGELPIIWIRK